MTLPPQPTAQVRLLEGRRAVVWAARSSLVLLVAVVFGRIVAFGPVNWDDFETIFRNPLFRSVPRDEAFAAAWTRPHLSLWIPVTHTLWAVLAMLGEDNSSSGRLFISPVPFRVASLLLHAVSSLLVFEIALRLLRRSLWPALLAAVVFAVHPVQVESVAWISGQKDVLAGTLTFAAVFAALRARSTSAADGAGERASSWHPFVAYGLAVAAMLAKPQAVVVVAIVPIVLRMAGASWRAAGRFAWPLLVPAAIVALVARAVQPAALVDAGPLWARPLVALDALGFYVRQLVWPAGLAIDYGRPPGSVLDARHVLFALATLLPVVGVAIVLRRRVPGLALGLAIAALAVAPVLGFVPFEFQQYATVSDHYLYTAMLGVGLAVASLASPLPTRIVGPLMIVVASILGARSFAQVAVWRDTTTLFTHNLTVTPTSLAAGRVLAAEHDDDRTKIDAYRAVLKSHPGDAITWFNLANALARVGEEGEAKSAFARAIELRPTHAGMRHNFAILLIGRGELDAAEAELREAVRLDPKSRASADALAKLRAMRGR